MLRTLLIVALLWGCKGKSDDKPADPESAEPVKSAGPTAPPEAPKTGSAVGPTLTLGTASLVIEKGTEREEISIDASGKVMSGGKQIGQLTAAGELQVDGKVVITIAPDGTIAIPGEPQEKMTIKEDGTLLDGRGKVMLAITDDGIVEGPLMAEAGGAKLTVTGDKAARRALMVAFLAAQ